MEATATQAQPRRKKRRCNALSLELLLATAAEYAAPGEPILQAQLARRLGVTPDVVRKAIARLRSLGRWPYTNATRAAIARAGVGLPVDQLAVAIANRELPARECRKADGSVVVHRNPGLHPDEVDDPKRHGVTATPHSINAPHHKAPKSNAELVAGYVREWKAIRRRHRKAVWA